MKHQTSREWIKADAPGWELLDVMKRNKTSGLGQGVWCPPQGGCAACTGGCPAHLHLSPYCKDWGLLKINLLYTQYLWQKAIFPHFWKPELLRECLKRANGTTVGILRPYFTERVPHDFNKMDSPKSWWSSCELFFWPKYAELLLSSLKCFNLTFGILVCACILVSISHNSPFRQPVKSLPLLHVQVGYRKCKPSVRELGYDPPLRFRVAIWAHTINIWVALQSRSGAEIST